MFNQCLSVVKGFPFNFLMNAPW